MRIGPYEVKARLGHGGMGEVFLAQHTTTGALVALKRAREVEIGHLASLRREIYALSRLRHPGIVRLVDHGTIDGLPWCALEFVEGQTVQTILEPHAHGHTRPAGLTPTTATIAPTAPHGDGLPYLPQSVRVAEPLGPPPLHIVSKCLAITKRLCEPLAFLHGEGIVHCDLKPANIVMRPDGTPVIIDFGLMMHFSGPHGRERMDEQFLAMGTVEYMAPERIRSELVDARADLYAVGCFLYEVLTGRTPFVGEPRAIMRQHLSARPLPPSAIVPGIAPELDELVLRLLEKDPRARLGYADSVAAALDAAGVQGSAPSSRQSEGSGPVTLPQARAYLYRPRFAGHAEAMRSITHEPVGLVLVAAESGAGKTRFAMEVARALAGGEMRIVAGECLPLGTEGAAVLGAPLHPMRPLLRLIADECRSQGPGMTDILLGRRGRVLADYEPTLLDLPEVAALPPPARLSPDAAQQRLHDDLAETIFAFAMIQRLVLIFDDLQWADELTLAFLLSLSPDALADRGVLVLGTYRKDEAGDALLKLASQRGVRRVELPRLDRASVASIARDMLALSDVPATLVDWLYSCSTGNPFFVAEHLRGVVEQGLLFRDARGSWSLGPSLGSTDLSRLPVPGSVRELLELRLGSLSGPARAWTEAAAVLGREADREVIERVARSPLETSADVAPQTGRARFVAVEELLARQILEEVPNGFRFVHDMLREVAYERMDPSRKRELHLASAVALEEIYQSRGQLPSAYASLAHHYGEAGASEKELIYLERAAESALSSGAYEQARALLSRLLEVDTQLGGRASLIDRARFHRWQGEAAYALGDLSGLQTNMVKGLEELGLPLPDSQIAWSAALAAGFARQAATFVAKRISPKLTARAEDRAARERHAEAAQMAASLAFRYFFAGDAAALIATSLLAVNEAEAASGVARGLSRPYAYLGYLTGLSRLHPVAQAYFESAASVGRAANDPDGVAYALTTKAVYRMCLCDWRAAEEAATVALSIQEANANAMEAELLRTILGNIEYFTGRLAQSRKTFEALHDAALRRHNQQRRAWGLYAMARCDLAEGRIEQALDLLRQAEVVLASLPEREEASELVVDGLFASAHVASEDLANAQIRADRIAARIDRPHVPTVFSTVHAYVALAEVRLLLWERAGARVSPPALRAVAWLSGFATMFPLAEPAALRCAAKARWLLGLRRLGLTGIERSVEAAVRLGMPHEEKLARHELEKLSGV